MLCIVKCYIEEMNKKNIALSVLYRKFTALTSCEREENRWPQAEDRTCHQRGRAKKRERERSISNNVVNNLQFILFYNILH